MGLWGRHTSWSVPAQLPDVPVIEASLEHLESTVIANRLDLANAGQEVEAQSAALGITRIWLYLLFSPIGIDAERDTSGQWATRPELRVKLPIFNQRQADIDRLKSNLRASKDRLTTLAIENRRSKESRNFKSRRFAFRPPRATVFRRHSHFGFKVPRSLANSLT